MTEKRLLKQFNVSAAMAKRLAQLYAGCTVNYGTPMAALSARGLVSGYYGEGPVQLTEEGRKTIEGLRAAGW